MLIRKDLCFVTRDFFKLLCGASFGGASSEHHFARVVGASSKQFLPRVIRAILGRSVSSRPGSFENSFVDPHSVELLLNRFLPE